MSTKAKPTIEEVLAEIRKRLANTGVESVLFNDPPGLVVMFSDCDVSISAKVLDSKDAQRGTQVVRVVRA